MNTHAPPPPLNPDRVRGFLSLLASAGFTGDIGLDEATRLVTATDNSIYQVTPAAVVFPRTGEDINLIVRLASDSAFAPIPITARGGGTGTNGQSLTDGVVIDVSRHLNRILAFDPVARQVTVEPGVVLDQLNAFLAPHGLFFPPNVSTATRATLGGMVATDASGKGSRLYGKTSDYIEALDIVLADGSDFHVAPMSAAAAEAVRREPTLAGRAVDQVLDTVVKWQSQIEAVFPKMNRGLTGYNLQAAWSADTGLALHRILAGSEGTLAVTKAITLRVAPKPKVEALGVVRYASFQGALADVARLIGADPLAVEVLDDKVLGLARQDVIWSSLETILGATANRPVGGLSFVEFVADDLAYLEVKLVGLRDLLSGAQPAAVIDWHVVTDLDDIHQLWTLREKSVGLAGRMAGPRQGVAFVEDTAVPPERLVDFVRDFRKILEGHGLTYAMYGHADVGCLHVRPALDMKDPADAALIRPISDAVAALVKHYGGLLWGEHGRGYRGEYSPLFFGPDLYAELCRIKGAFDPDNIFNPGKLAAPPGGAPVQRIDATRLRGSVDAEVSPRRAQGFDRALACNGNGVCFSWDADEAMCPSYKATRDRVQSPKGRATLLREWARRQTATDRSGNQAGLAELETAVHAALSTCLSCKACATACPIQVDIPAMKARFLGDYYRKRRRPARDWVVAAMEPLARAASRVPHLANLIMGGAPGKMALAALGLVDLPPFSVVRAPNGRLDLVALSRQTPQQKQRTVILAPDSFTSAFNSNALIATQALLIRLGYDVHLAPLRANGKALHVLGLLQRFAPHARAARARHRAYLATGVAVVGVEPVAVLMDRMEYCNTDDPAPDAVVRTLDEFLYGEITAGRIARGVASEKGSIRLFLHCTERSAMPAAAGRWRAVFAAFGLSAETPKTGCCGMAGLFGHEREHAEMSRQLFDMSWRGPLEAAEGRVAATGFSCRCQIERMTGRVPMHPAEVLLETLSPPRAGKPLAAAERHGQLDRRSGAGNG